MAGRVKTKPGDWWLGLGGLGLIGGLTFGAIELFDHLPEFTKFKTDGLVTDAIVSAKDAEVSNSTSSGRRSRRRTTTRHFLEVSFSTPGAQPYAQADAAPAQAPQPQSGNPIDRIEFGYTKDARARVSGPLDGRAQLRVSTADYEKATVGGAVNIVFLKDESTRARLTSDVRNYSPALPLTIALLAGLIGGAACWVGWRKRKAAQVA